MRCSIITQNSIIKNKFTLDQMFVIYYTKLKTIARSLLMKETNPHSLTTTELVHESYIRLAKGKVNIRNIKHLYYIAGRAMSRTLIDEARKRKTIKRNNGFSQISIEIVKDIPNDRLCLIVCEKLEIIKSEMLRLKKCNKRMYNIVKQVYILGFSVKETATNLKVSRGTVEIEINKAKAFISATLTKSI